MGSVSKNTYVDVDVEISFEDIVDDLNPKERRELAGMLIAANPDGMPDVDDNGDYARAQTLLNRAYNAARAIPDCPRDIEDYLWHVHGLAL